MEMEQKEIIVLGAIKNGAKNFNKIRKTTNIDSEELNQILEKLEEKGWIGVRERKGLFGKKIEIFSTDKGDKEVEQKIHEMEENWGQMVALYKKGDKDKLNSFMDDNRSFLPMMMFFGIMDMMMFSMMFSMIGSQMTDYVPPEDMPADIDGGDYGDAGEMGDGGGFDIDIGF